MTSASPSTVLSDDLERTLHMIAETLDAYCHMSVQPAAGRAVLDSKREGYRQLIHAVRMELLAAQRYHDMQTLLGQKVAQLEEDIAVADGIIRATHLVLTTDKTLTGIDAVTQAAGYLARRLSSKV